MPTPNAKLPTVPNGQTNLSQSFNEAMQILDALTPLAVQAMNETDPPSTSAGDAGKRWIPATGATGAWAGQAGRVALCTAPDVWAFIDPPPYIVAFNIDDGDEYRYVEGVWTIIA